ncbi:MAG: hypothetical protein KDB22_08050 [Planctomycetales bacterium]|nr:hypothetical protein [Planctomycetales bacterium]
MMVNLTNYLSWIAVCSAWLAAELSCAQGPATPRPIDAQREVDESSSWQFQYDLFQMSLEKAGLNVSTELSTALLAPRKSVVVVLGPQSWNSQLLRFVSAGGAVLISSDTPLRVVRGIEVRGGPVMTADSGLAYQQFPDCLALQIRDDSHPLMRNVSTLVFNRTGWIEGVGNSLASWDAVLTLPRRSLPPECIGKPVVATLVREQFDGGRIALVADRSIFCNGMLWHGDNAIFAINMVNFLTEGGRTNLVFLVGHQVHANFKEEFAKHQSMPLPELTPEQIPELEMEQMLQVANSVIAKAEDADLLNELLADRPRQIRTPYYQRGLLFALVAALLALFAYQFWGRSRKLLPTLEPAKIFAPKSPQKARSSAAEQAQRRGEAIKIIAQQFLTAHFDTDSPEQWQQRISRNRTSSEEYAQWILIYQIASQEATGVSQSRLIAIQLIIDGLSKSPVVNSA